MAVANPLPNFAARGAVDLSVLNRPVAPPPGEPGGAPLAGGYVVDVTTENFPQVVQDSARYPVLVLLWLPTDQANAELGILLGRLAAEAGGKFLLARVDVGTQPEIAAAFQVEGVPTVAAILAGQPIPLFAGAAAEDQVRAVLGQILAAAAQNGIKGRAPFDGVPAEPTPEELEPDEPPLPPLHEEAFTAIEEGDYEAAANAYRKAIKQDPHDAMAVAGLAQVQLMARTAEVDPAPLRAAAEADPRDLTAALAVADVDVMQGQVDDAFARLLGLLPNADADTKEAIRLRLLEYFEVLGAADPRVTKARQKLALYLY
ncbi:MAG: tetratricopeptide repeat protein [Cellulomonadaceae bacterium]|nr:tetratricopeptide repeat protein [Cellulomonadaceae bacterium]